MVRMICAPSATFAAAKRPHGFAAAHHPRRGGLPPGGTRLQEAEEANKVKNAGYELAIKGALLRFLSILIGQHGTSLPADTTDTRRLKTVLQLIEAEYATPLRIEDAAEACGCSQSHFMRWFKK